MPASYQRKYQWPNLGNKSLIDFLDQSIANNKLAQTYVFSGLEYIGKNTTALAFATNLLLSDGRKDDNFSAINSDLYILEKEEGKKNISVEAVRDFVKKLSLSSFLNSYKIGIIKNAESLSLEAANALLKTLEEPRDKVVIILQTSAIDSLLPTILSRAQVLYFYPASTEDVYDYLVSDLKLKRDDARDMAALSAGRPLLAAKFAQDDVFYNQYLSSIKLFVNFFNQEIPGRLKSWTAFTGFSGAMNIDKTLNILDNWQRVLRDLILLSINCPEIIQHTILKDELTKTLDILKDKQGDNLSLYFLNLIELFKVLKKYASANVSPANVIEQVIYNL